jgi:hypothetical protein
MSPPTMLVIAGIIAAFAVFGVTLAWAEHQTRHLSRALHGRPADAKEPKEDLKLAA